MIEFEAKPYELNGRVILRLPKAVSDKLPSRGQVMVAGKINGADFKSPLEPDGEWGHWLQLDRSFRPGETGKIAFAVIKDWPEPEVPKDFWAAVKQSSAALATWQKGTAAAHWEWLRWIRGTANQETYDHRIEVGVSKLSKGERRPCCWNRNACSIPEVSKSGVLLAPSGKI